MPQLNGALVDSTLITMFTCFLVSDVANVLEDLDDELLSYNNFILVN